MSILKDVWDRLGHRSPGGFRSLSLLRGASCSPGFILNCGSRLVALGPETPPTLSLSGRSFTFLEGRWVSSSHGEDSESSSKARRLRQEKRALREENNGLKQRLELLMDMLTEAMAQLGGLRQERGREETPAQKSHVGHPVNSFRQ